MNNQNFQSFSAAPSQTQVYPDGTVRILQNSNPLAQDPKWMATAAMTQQPSQDQHPHQHPQIIPSNKVQSQTIYYSQDQAQRQAALLVKPTSLTGNGMTTPPMPYNTNLYSAQGQIQGQAQAQAQAQAQTQVQAQAQAQAQAQGQVQITNNPLYSTSPLNIQIANNPSNSTTVNTLSTNNDNVNVNVNGTSTVIMPQQSGTNVLSDINTSYAVGQAIQAQEAKNYNTSPIFVLPSPSTPTQMNFTTTTAANSNPTIVQVQQTQTPPQTTLPLQQTPPNGSQYIITQKPGGQGVGMASTPQVILQAPPTPYGTSPTGAQVQVLTQTGHSNFANTAMVSPTQIQYQYSVTPPPLGTTDKDIQLKQEGQNIIGAAPGPMNYTNPSMIKTPTNKGTNGYNARTKNSHIVDPDVPLEVLIKRRKNTEAARRSRLRKAERIQVLTEIVHNLEEKNREYTIKIAELQGEQANWLKKESEYTLKIKELQERLNDSTPNSANSTNDENDKNSFNLSTPTTATNTDTESTTTETVPSSSVTIKDSNSEN